MDLPTLQEIEIHDYEVQSLLEKFRDSKVGERPCFIVLNMNHAKYVEPALDNIMAALEVLNVDPRFPFPLYVITPHRTHYLDLPLLPDKSHLPNHFFCRSNRMNSKEQSLAKKNIVLANKIKNNEIQDITVALQSNSNARRKLAQVCEEIDFLEEVVDGLQRPTPKGDRKV